MARYSPQRMVRNLAPDALKWPLKQNFLAPMRDMHKSIPCLASVNAHRSIHLASWQARRIDLAVSPAYSLWPTLIEMDIR